MSDETDMPDDYRTVHSELNDLLDQLYGNERWSVDGYELESGAYEFPSVTIELERIPKANRPTPTGAKAVKEAIKKHEGPEGAPIEAVLDEPNATEADLDELRRKGEVYEPTKGKVRTT
jgi:hypothetical protein